VSLEDAFWAEFRRIAAEQQRPINDLAAEIDARRGENTGLASAIRLFILNRLTEARDAHQAQSHPADQKPARHAPYQQAS
jgi:predicted DNA-binding ribbon-helix-helix protein